MHVEIYHIIGHVSRKFDLATLNRMLNVVVNLSHCVSYMHVSKLENISTYSDRMTLLIKVMYYLINTLGISAISTIIFNRFLTDFDDWHQSDH